MRVLEADQKRFPVAYIVKEVLAFFEYLDKQ